jgi:glutathione S-transferase
MLNGSHGPPHRHKMPLTVHHLQSGQSERIVWLCEELQIPYHLVLHQRAPVFSPQSIKDLNPLGQAPVIQDGNLTLAESAACAEYIIHIHSNGRLALLPSHKNYANYLYWFHFANGTLQPHILTVLQISHLDREMTSPAAIRNKERLAKMLEFIDARLNQSSWLAGEEFTAADIMTVFTLTTMRSFYPYDLSGYQGILGYLERVVKRDGYRNARAKADPELELMIEGKPPRTFVEKLKAEGKL